jgi:hypothetical protein
LPAGHGIKVEVLATERVALGGGKTRFSDGPVSTTGRPAFSAAWVTE